MGKARNRITSKPVILQVQLERRMERKTVVTSHAVKTAEKKDLE